MIVLSILSFSTALGYPLLKYGSRGQAVIELQEELKNQGYFTFYKVTDYYGTITQDAVIKFQKAKGLTVDGIAGNQTQSALYTSSNESSITKYKLLRYGMRNLDVTNVQNALKTLGYFNYTSTGYYGLITQNAVIEFQKDNSLIVDGIAGPQTQTKLFSIINTTDRGNITETQREDIMWLSRIIYAESSGEPYNGKIAVGNVVMNRVKSSSFPNTVYDVIFEYYKGIPQFSPVADGTIYNDSNYECRKAAEEAYFGKNIVGSSLYFFNPKKASATWIVNNKKYITTIANHVFYE